MWNWLWVVVAVVARTEGARFLAFLPWPLRSHLRVFEPLLQELVLRGHHVTFYTPFPIDRPLPNYTQVILPDTYTDMIKSFKLDGYKDFAHYPNIAAFFVPFGMRYASLTSSKIIMESAQFEDLINSDLEFDALILESGINSEAYIGLKHRFKAINIEILPTCNYVWAHWIFGNPYDSSFLADFSLPYTNEMGLWERAHSTFTSFMIRTIGWAYMPWYKALMDKHIRYPGWEERPSLWDMLADTAVVLANCHVATNYPNPVTSNFKDVGGINLRKPEPLSKELQKFMDSAEEGVIYFTLGSHTPPSQVLGEFVQDIVKAFGELKQKVLWKWDAEIADLPENVKLGRWFPQQSILAHKNLRLFITHGGMLSLVEAVYEGVPLIGIPIFGDQRRNVRHMEHFGYGLPLYLPNISYTTISWSISHVLDNPRYKEKAFERQKLLRDELYTPLEKAVYWTEYAVRHRGAPHLRPAVSRLPWYQEALLDVYLTLAFIILLPLYLFYRTTRCVLSRFFTTRNSNSTGTTTSKFLEKKTQITDIVNKIIK